MSLSTLHGFLIELRDQINALDLAGIATDNVVVCGSPAIAVSSMPAKMYPAVVIGPYGAEVVESFSNRSDTVTYPVLVAIVDTLAQDAEQPFDRQTLDIDRRLYWRQQIRRAVSNQRLTQTTGFKVAVQMLQIVEPAGWQRDLWVSSMVLRVSERETHQ